MTQMQDNFDQEGKDSSEIAVIARQKSVVRSQHRPKTRPPDFTRDSSS